MTTVPLEPVAAPQTRWPVLRGRNVSDRLYRGALTALALMLPLLLVAFLGELVTRAWAPPTGGVGCSLQRAGGGAPRGGSVRGGADDLWHARVLLPGPAHRGPPGPRGSDLSHGVRPQMAAPADRLSRGAAGRDPERRVRPLGRLRPDPVPPDLRRASAASRVRLDAVSEWGVLRQLTARGLGHSGDHDRALHRGGVP